MPDLKVNCQLPNFNANLPRKCQLANREFSLPTAFEKCQIRESWQSQMPVGNPGSM